MGAGAIIGLSFLGGLAQGQATKQARQNQRTVQALSDQAEEAAKQGNLAFLQSIQDSLKKKLGPEVAEGFMELAKVRAQELAPIRELQESAAESLPRTGGEEGNISLPSGQAGVATPQGEVRPAQRGRVDLRKIQETGEGALELAVLSPKLAGIAKSIVTRQPKKLQRFDLDTISLGALAEGVPFERVSSGQLTAEEARKVFARISTPKKQEAAKGDFKRAAVDVITALNQGPEQLRGLISRSDNPEVPRLINFVSAVPNGVQVLEEFAAGRPPRTDELFALLAADTPEKLQEALAQGQTRGLISQEQAQQTIQQALGGAEQAAPETQGMEGVPPSVAARIQRLPEGERAVAAEAVRTLISRRAAGQIPQDQFLREVARVTSPNTGVVEGAPEPTPTPTR